MKTNHGSAIAFGIAGLALVACGGAAPDAQAPMAPSSAGEAAPASLEEASQELDRSEGELQRLLGGGGATQSDAKKGADAEAPVAPAATAAPLGGGEPCGAACRALASMQRAVDHLCGLAGEGEARCQGARARVASAAERVQAACPACSAPGFATPP